MKETFQPYVFGTKMINNKSKIITILIVMVLGLLLSAFRSFDRSKNANTLQYKTINELKDKTLGGITTKMPEESTKILFEGILGFKLKNYYSYDSLDETLYALRVNEISVAWFSDVTAKYLLKTQEDLKELPSNDIIEEDRLEFAMALRPKDVSLRDELNLVIEEMRKNGTLKKLTDTYIDWEVEPEPFYETDMISKKKKYPKTIYIGITGMTPPIDMVDQEGKPYGFAVAFMDEIAKLNDINVKFITIKNEAAFSCLMNGKIDVLFCYGTSYSTLDPDNVDKKREYVMTNGYYSMNKYAFLCLE